MQSSGSTALIAFAMVASLVAFLLYNWYPARVFPGDTLTYSVGATIAVVTILGNVEKFAMVLFLPYFVEFFLKSRSGWKAESFLTSKKEEVFSISHLFAKCHLFRLPTELAVVLFHFALELICVLLAVVLL